MRRTMTALLVGALLIAVFASSSTPQLSQAATLPTVHPFYIVEPNVSTATYTTGLTPQQVRGAYGVSSTFTGKGITIAIVDAYDSPTAATDFDVFSRQFGLPTVSGGCGCFQKVDQTGGTAYPVSNTGWAMEIALDIEWAHAMAPQAKILLIEANTSGFADMLIAETYATAHAQVVSNSWGAAEFAGETALDGYFNQPNVAILASAGDNGYPASYPSASPYVISVGGTALTIAGTCGTNNWATKGCSWGSETTWTTVSACFPLNTCGGTGGGVSAYEAMPTYQTGYCGATANVNNCAGNRGTPDIAWVADPATGVAVYNTTCTPGSCNWTVVGGTSNSSPSLAGLIADVDASRHITLTTNSLTTRFTYQNAAQGWNYARDYKDISTGSNITNSGTCCLAGAGYDLVTGVGTPIGSNWITNT